MTGIELEKISDIDKYLFIEKETRGGISYIAKDMPKQTINTWMIVIRRTVNIYNLLG